MLSLSVAPAADDSYSNLGRDRHAARSALEGRSAPRDRRGARPAPKFRLDVDRPQVAVLDILERDGHDFGGAVDFHVPKELQAVTGR